MPSRWEHLLDTKPVPLAEHLLDEVARLLAADLARWPLPIASLAPDVDPGLAALLTADAPRPGAATFDAGLRLARWDLLREHAAYDDFVRNRRYLEAGVPEAERPAMLLVARWVLEQLLGLSEATEGRVKRPALASLVERLARRLAVLRADRC